MTSILKKVVAVLALSAWAFMPAASLAQEAQEAETVEQEAEKPRPRINYSKIDEFYDVFGVQKGDRRIFRFSAMTENAARVSGGFVSSLSNIKPSTLPEDEQLAYWLNLRNLLIIRAIASETPKRNIKKARGDFENPGEMWTRKRLEVEGKQISIDDIEKKYLLANWSSPDILYGMYQGARGGPAFAMPATFSSDTVWEKLKQQGAQYVNSKRVISVRSGKAQLPSVYGWYKDSLFGGDDNAVLQHLREHATGDLAADLAEATSISVKKMDYKLDAVPAPRQRNANPTGFPGGGGGGGLGGGGSGS